MNSNKAIIAAAMAMLFASGKYFIRIYKLNSQRPTLQLPRQSNLGAHSHLLRRAVVKLGGSAGLYLDSDSSDHHHRLHCLHHDEHGR
jgi:hypothetical protein